MYEVYLERAAERDLKRLPKELFQKIISTIEILAENPKPLGCRRIVSTQHDWRIRVGNYRIIYEINENEQVKGFCGSGIGGKRIGNHLKQK